jgi:hypothetical protein
MTPDTALALWIAFAGGPLCVSDASVATYETIIFKSPCEPQATTRYVVTNTSMAPAPPEEIVEVTEIAEAKPVAKAKPRKRSSPCGSKRQVWRTAKGGTRKYRCR